MHDNTTRDEESGHELRANNQDFENHFVELGVNISADSE